MSQEQQPLFNFIYDQGDPDQPVEQKFEIVASAESILAHLDVHPDLVADVALYTNNLRQLNALVLGRAPTDEETNELEGRGMFVDKVPVQGTTLEAVVYIKGIGNSTAARTTKGPFAGFPSDTKNLFFDSLQNNDRHPHPRIRGTETVTWGAMEFVNAAIVFAHMAEKKGWRSVAEAVEAGVTIPLNLAHFPELSNYMREKIEQIKEQLPESASYIIKDALSWEGNEAGLGTVSLIVPSTQRRAQLLPHSGFRFVPKQDAVDVFDPNIAKLTGHTLRELLDVGFTYSEGSSHGSNIYDRGVMIQADNSDFVPLGLCEGREGRKVKGSEQRMIDKETEQIALIYYQLNNNNLLTPPIFPNHDEQRGSYKQVQEAYAQFWGEFLKGVVPDTVPSVLARLMSFAPSEINLAVAAHMVDNLDRHTWHKTALQQANLLKLFDQYYAPEELKRKYENNLEDHKLNPILKVQYRTEPLRSFLTTGDINNLLQDDYFGTLLELEEALKIIDDDPEEVELLSKTTNVHSQRQSIFDGLQRLVNARSIENFTEASVIPQTYLEGIDLRFIAKLFREGQKEKAIHAISILHRVAAIAALYRLFPSDEVEPYLLLTDMMSNEIDMEALAIQVEYRHKINQLYNTIFGPFSSMGQEGFIPFYPLVQLLKQQSDLKPSIIARIMMLSTSEGLQRLKGEEYNKAQFQFYMISDEINQEHNQSEAIWEARLRVAEKFQTNWPEFSVGIALAAYNDLFRKQSKELAMYEEVISNYIQNQLNARQEELGIRNQDCGIFDFSYQALLYRNARMEAFAKRFEDNHMQIMADHCRTFQVANEQITKAFFKDIKSSLLSPRVLMSLLAERQ